MLQPRTKRSPRRHGSGLIIVLALLTVMSVYLVANGVALDRLRRTLDEVEQRQVQRYTRARRPEQAAPPRGRPEPPRPSPPTD